MTDETHFELAYWSVMSTLHPGDIPVARLNKLKPNFLSSLGDSYVAGRILCTELADIPWDWPMWYYFAHRDGWATLNEISHKIADMESGSLLESATKPELQRIAELWGIRVLSKWTKPTLIGALCKTLDSATLAEIARPFGERALAKQQDSCRKWMAMLLASRVASVALNAKRYEQLADPGFRALCPFWQFIWVDDDVTPHVCKKFDRKILPVEDAYREFPHLPCEHLRCSCRLYPVSTLNG